jgi:hypothetical protein
MPRASPAISGELTLPARFGRLIEQSPGLYSNGESQFSSSLGAGTPFVRSFQVRTMDVACRFTYAKHVLRLLE